MTDALDVESQVDRILATGRFRILRRLDVDRLPLSAAPSAATGIGLVVDCETDGLGTPSRSARIIELSLRRFLFDAGGEITRIGRSHSWLEDPGRPLDPFVSRLTGLTDADVAGRTIDERAAGALLRSADVRIAFNAGFDRPIVERRLPAVAGLPWACALKEVDWRGRGFDGSGRSLPWLLAQAGWFYGAHRAGADVDATITVLAHRGHDGRTALAELLATAGRPGRLFRAVGADFLVKDALRARGYLWDPEEKVWFREVGEADRFAEGAWLADNVYAPEHTPRMDGPAVREVTWETRHGR